MKINTFFRHWREGVKSLFRNGWMSFASISAIAISLFILGAFLMLTLNVNHISEQVESDVEISVHLDVNIQEPEIRSLQNEIGSIPEVQRVIFVSKEQGLEEMKEIFGEEGGLILEGYEGDSNPLPDSFIVEVENPENIASVAEQIEAINIGKDPKPIFRVNYGEGTVETLFAITRFIRYVGLIIVAGLAFTAMFLIANTIKLTIIARRKEIAIMKLVGATNSFIRWPFFIEGVLLGLIGAGIPISILLGVYSTLDGSFRLGLMAIELAPMQQISSLIFMLLLSIGLVIGVWGSLLSVRKFLRV